MWPWNRPPNPSEMPEGWEDRLHRVEKTQERDRERLVELDELPRLAKSVEELAASVRKVRLEWQDVYDRIERIVGRINARNRKQLREEEEPTQEAEPDINEQIRNGSFVFPSTGRRS